MVSLAAIVIAVITLVKIKSFQREPNLSAYKTLKALKITSIVFVPLTALSFLSALIASMSVVLVVTDIYSYSSEYNQYAVGYGERASRIVVFIFFILYLVISAAALVLSIIALIKSSALVGKYKNEMEPPVIMPFPYSYQYQTIQQQIYCTKCGAANPGGAAYCNSCGGPIEKR